MDRQRPTDQQSDWASVLTRFGFGAAAGCLIGFSIVRFDGWHHLEWDIAGLLFITGLFGGCAAKYGDSFWMGLSRVVPQRVWRWWW